MTRDFNLLNLRTPLRMLENIIWAWAGTAGATSGRNWGAAVKADTIGEQQLKRIDTIGEQQLKRTQSGSSSSAQRAVRRRITHVGE